MKWGEKVKFLLFANDVYYATGGWNDFRGAFETLDGARSFFETGDCGHAFEWGHVVDTESLEVVWRDGGAYGSEHRAEDDDERANPKE